VEHVWLTVEYLNMRAVAAFYCFKKPCFTAKNTHQLNNNNNDRLTAFDPGQPG